MALDKKHLTLFPKVQHTFIPNLDYSLKYLKKGRVGSQNVCTQTYRKYIDQENRNIYKYRPPLCM